MIREFFQRISKKKSIDNLSFDINQVEKLIGYNFINTYLIIQAFKHRSYLTIANEKSTQSNERLEFLGDAVLDLIITDYLIKKYKDETEGNLSKKKSILVSRQVLAGISESLGLGRFLLLNKGEEKTGGRTRQSNLANLFEAILGAIYLDGGLKAAIEFSNRFLIRNSDKLLAKATYTNYKSELLEYAQSKGWGIPKYSIFEVTGPDHNKRFEVEAIVKNTFRAKGGGRTKKKAEQIAAKNVLKKIQLSEESYSTE